MNLNRQENIKFMINGKIISIRCLFWGIMLNKIPTYASRNIHDIALLETNDNSLFLLINDEYYINNKDEADMKIYNTVLKKYYNNADKICDIYTAMQFGFTKTISLIKSCGKNSEARSLYLENIFRNRDKLKIKSINIDDILSSYKYVNVN